MVWFFHFFVDGYQNQMEIVSQRLQDKWKKHTTSETAQENSLAKVFFGVGWGWGSVVGAEKAELPTFCILHSTMGFFFFFFFFSPSFFFFFSSQVKQWEWRRNKEICNWLWSINCKHHCTRTSRGTRAHGYLYKPPALHPLLTYGDYLQRGEVTFDTV